MRLSRLAIPLTTVLLALGAWSVPLARADFGVDSFDGDVLNLDGSVASQAGSHPYGASTTIMLKTHPSTPPGGNDPDGSVKDLVVELPPGFVGYPSATPTRCGLAELVTDACPPSSQVGMTIIHLWNTDLVSPVYSMVAPPDIPAQFGFAVVQHPVLLRPSVRGGSDFGLTVSSLDITQSVVTIGANLTFWGVPADPVHDEQRCPQPDIHVDPPVCDGPPTFDDRSNPHSAGVPPVPFLRNPTSCTPPGLGLETRLSVDSWQNPGVLQHASFFSHFPAPDQSTQVGPTGCDLVPFDPSISAQPALSRSSAPSGWSFDIGLPQNDNPDGLAQADLKMTVLTLPQGVSVNPAAADGLGSCSSAQIGLLGTNFPAPNPIHFNESEPACPENSRVGTVTITTPLLEAPMQGSVYLASQNDNPFHSLLALYLVAKGPGIQLKLPGVISADPSTGRLTATFDNNPQLPFSNLHLQLKDGPRSPLINPPACGTYTTTAAFSSWARPDSPVLRTSSFQVDSSADGGPCGAQGFAPSFKAGAATNQAAALTPFGVTIARTDQEQQLSSIQVTTPPGLLGVLKGVPLCVESDANAGTCPAASQIGHTTVTAGAGSNPISIPVAGQPANPVFLTQGYRGAPFGLSVVVPAIAGPFNLGTVVVRAAIRVDPHTSQITITSDALPRILQGIPLQLRSINVTVDRPGFTFNPTDCNPLSVSATLASIEGATAAVASPFQVANCAALKFKPSFSVSTAAKTSKANGASLHVHLATHEGPAGAGVAGESNIAKVDVQLPVVLPARLPTLQKACTAAQFATDPAGCPAGSFVGTAVAHTPILASPLSGPAILVSHGGEAFPDLVLVLQGEGIRIDLTGHTQIKKGITYNHFETVPDAPVSSFDLTLPAGPHGVLTTDIPGRNLCATTRTVTVTKRITRRVNGHTRRVTVKAKKAVAAPLLMPTTMTAQNGAVVHQNTKIAVTGCAKAMTVKHAAKRKK